MVSRRTGVWVPAAVWAMVSCSTVGRRRRRCASPSGGPGNDHRGLPLKAPGQRLKVPSWSRITARWWRGPGPATGTPLRPARARWQWRTPAGRRCPDRRDPDQPAPSHPRAWPARGIVRAASKGRHRGGLVSRPPRLTTPRPASPRRQPRRSPAAPPRRGRPDGSQCRPHSLTVSCSHHQRPDRGSPPG